MNFKCVERGLLSLDSPDDIARLLPEIAAPEILSLDATGTPITVPAKNRITLRQLLTHTSGLSYEFMDPRLATWRKSPAGRRAAAHSDLFTAKFLLPLVYEPGEAWMYSIGLDWAGKLVERANGGVALEAYMQQHIWDPLGIQDITFHLEKKPRVKENLVEMTARVAESGFLIPAENEYIPEKIKIEQGGAGLWGSAPEYLKVLASILRDDGKLVNSATITEMFKPQLGPASQEAWMKMLRAMDSTLTVNAASSTEFSWGLGGQYNLDDMPEGRRKKGSLAGGGLPNLFWWIDPAAGVAGLYASQVIPTGDPKSTEMFAEFEKDIYKQTQAL
ncbi:beta-lactamase/transpeptidase-like protein [Athelia psychrophila]|uniref:Beta-lactamase/transpeptidase-like protein n=1 Tax=Athelia psychrophila TaxID=1759441 RepID=A0A166QLQ7_9AGAM|nr:beta-lactamase/transpeptidase-like protein [Fibularhizoctonia sp. CBS 109695]